MAALKCAVYFSSRRRMLLRGPGAAVFCARMRCHHIHLTLRIAAMAELHSTLPLKIAGVI